MMINRYEISESDEAGNPTRLMALAEQKRMAFKEQVTFFSDAGKSRAVFGFKARKRLDLNAGYDITDESGAQIGYFKKDFGASLLRSTFHIEGPGFAGTGQERNQVVALLRRFTELDFLPIHFDFVDTEGRAALLGRAEDVDRRPLPRARARPAGRLPGRRGGRGRPRRSDVALSGGRAPRSPGHRHGRPHDRDQAGRARPRRTPGHPRPRRHPLAGGLGRRARGRARHLRRGHGGRRPGRARRQRRERTRAPGAGRRPGRPGPGRHLQPAGLLGGLPAHAERQGHRLARRADPAGLPGLLRRQDAQHADRGPDGPPRPAARSRPASSSAATTPRPSDA